jgi:hypothetical protein
LPTSTSHVGIVATGMNTPETNASVTVENGPMAEAESAVVARAVSASPMAHMVAVPTTV